MSLTLSVPYPGHTNVKKIFFGHHPKRTFIRLVIWNIVLIALFHYLLVPIRIIGSSMDPTYHSGAVNLINRTAYLLKIPKRDDVIVLRDGADVLLKRIVGVPGEIVSMQDGTIFINGRALTDRFSISKVTEDMPAILLREGEYFFIGDNREISDFGKVSKTAILGRIVF